MSTRYTALVLAGRRGGADPVAESAGVTNKALALVGGVPLIHRVVDALRSAPSITDIVVATDDADVARAAGDVTIVSTAASPAATVAQVLRDFSALLVTTADHGMLSDALVETFCAAVPSTCDVAAGIVPRHALERLPERRTHIRHSERSEESPASGTPFEEIPRSARDDGGFTRSESAPGDGRTRRTFYRLADGDYCGANLYAFVGGRGVQAANFWVGLEAQRKSPLRLAARIGPMTLLRYAMRSLDLAGAFALLSRRAGATVVPVVLDDPDAAIDVDTPEDLAEVRARLTGGRRCGRSP